MQCCSKKRTGEIFRRGLDNACSLSSCILECGEERVRLACWCVETQRTHDRGGVRHYLLDGFGEDLIRAAEKRSALRII